MLYQRPRKIDTVLPGKVAKRVLLASTKNTSHNRRKERALVKKKNEHYCHNFYRQPLP